MDRNTLRKALTTLVQEETGEVHESMEDNLSLRESLGLDSIDVVTLVINIQERFRIELKTEELEKIVTVGNLLDLIQTKLPSAAAA